MAIALIDHTVANNTSGLSIATNKPAGVSSGDFCILFYQGVINVTGSSAVTWPTGFTQIGSLQSYSSQNLHGAAWKILDGTEGSTFTVTENGTGNGRHILEAVAYSGVHATTPINAHAENATGKVDSTHIDAPSVTTTIANCQLITSYTLGYWGDASFSTPTGMSLLDTAYSALQSDNYGAMSCYDEALGAAGSTGTRTTTLTGITYSGATEFSIALAPAASGGTSWLTTNYWWDSI